MRHRHRWGRKVIIPVETNFEIQQLIPIPQKSLEPIILTKEELEILKLIDYDNLTQEQVAILKGCSRSTISRILNSTRRKIIEAIIFCKPIKIE